MIKDFIKMLLGKKTSGQQRLSDTQDFLKECALNKDCEKAVEKMPLELFDPKVFTEEIYKEFDNVLKENPYGMPEECLKRINGIEIVNLSKDLSGLMEVSYRSKYDNEVFEYNFSYSGSDTPYDLATLFYGRILMDYDPLENDPEVKAIIKKAREEANRRLADAPRPMGFIHQAWGLQKKILKEEYNIDWKTPRERHPHNRYD